jgi:hypothetical protein
VSRDSVLEQGASAWTSTAATAARRRRTVGVSSTSRLARAGFASRVPAPIPSWRSATWPRRKSSLGWTGSGEPREPTAAGMAGGSLDHLIRPRQQRWRDREAEGLLCRLHSDPHGTVRPIRQDPHGATLDSRTRENQPPATFYSAKRFWPASSVRHICCSGSWPMPKIQPTRNPADAVVTTSVPLITRPVMAGGWLSTPSQSPPCWRPGAARSLRHSSSAHQRAIASPRTSSATGNRL